MSHYSLWDLSLLLKIKTHENSLTLFVWKSTSKEKESLLTPSHNPAQQWSYRQLRFSASILFSENANVKNCAQSVKFGSKILGANFS